jgi:cobalamin biosynthesis Mg chelatase CobN
MKSFRKLIVFSLVMAGFLACQREPGNLNALKEKMQAAGYSGEYRQPNSTLEKMALNLIGMNDLLIYHDANLKAFVFKVKEGKDPKEALDQVEDYLRRYVTFSDDGEEKEMEEIWGKVRNDAKVRGQFLLVWYGDNEEDLLRAFRFF